jgi:hypothetical protein
MSSEDKNWLLAWLIAFVAMIIVSWLLLLRLGPQKEIHGEGGLAIPELSAPSPFSHVRD